PRPAISSPSLHDALPISSTSSRAGSTRACGWPHSGPTGALASVQCIRPERVSRITGALANRGRRHYLLGQELRLPGHLEGTSGTDRKSTRLNSSHQIISY